MAISSALSALLRTNLDKVEVPQGYKSLRSKLKDIKPTREPPAVKESPRILAEATKGFQLISEKPGPSKTICGSGMFCPRLLGSRRLVPSPQRRSHPSVSA